VASEVREPVAVVGDDSMGSTLAHVMASNGHPCALWCRRPETAEAIAREGRHPARPRYALGPLVRATASLQDAVRGAALVVVAVPSGAFRAAAEELGAVVDPGQVLLSSTKGVEAATLRCMTELLAECTRSEHLGAVTGPNITPEIMEGQPSAVMVASPSPRARKLARRALATARLRVGTCPDLRSAELAAVLKNVAAVAVGIAAGMEMGHNGRGMVFAAGLAEVERLGAAMGADARVFGSGATLADLFLTATSPQSLNRRLGVELGRGRMLDEVLGELPEVPEGMGAVRACRRLAERHGLSLPMCEVTAAILEGEAPPEALGRVLMEMQQGDGE
jgi:glycerol-3-phosphate dehydrogenase (NAD(P)+)